MEAHSITAGRHMAAMREVRALEHDNTRLLEQASQLATELGELQQAHDETRECKHEIQRALFSAENDLTQLRHEVAIRDLELAQRRSEAAARGLRVEELENALVNLLRYSVGQRGFDGRKEAKKLLGWET